MGADAGRRIFEEGRWTGFEEGREVGQREGLPFSGVSPLPSYHRGASFRFAESWVDSFLDYERDLTLCLRVVQGSRFFGRDNPGGGNEVVLAAAQKEIEVELDAVRCAVDVEVERGHGPQRITEALRGPPRRPRGVREYPDVDTFVAEDDRRALQDWPNRRDAGGSDAGFGWGIERPIRRWETTAWRISWLGNETSRLEDRGPTNEVYAIEEGVSVGDGRRGTGRVWLLGSLPTWDDVKAVVFPLYAVRLERNSLVAAANAISAASLAQPPPEVDY